MTTLDTSTIQTLIPNRYPLFYIDRVTELVPDESIVAEKYVSVAEDHLVAYLPGELTMPPTLIIETLAQAASILILKSPKLPAKLLIWQVSAKQNSLNPFQLAVC